MLFPILSLLFIVFNWQARTENGIWPIMNLRLNLAEIILPFGVYKCIIILLLCYVGKEVSVGDGISEEAFVY